MGVSLTGASIFNLRVEAIVNPVNCVGVSGAGLAKEFARRFPDNERKYRAACNSGTIRPGRGLITGTGLESPRHNGELVRLGRAIFTETATPQG